jgi:hypothetical protein
MSTKRVLLVILVASLVVLAVGVGPGIADTTGALLLAQEPEASGMTIPYSGRLADAVGLPVADAPHDFYFALYETETEGDPLWSELQEGVAVTKGAFAVSLGRGNPIPTVFLDGEERWLAVGVRGPEESDFTALTPRQRLSAADAGAAASPAAGAACPHDHMAEEWVREGPGLYVDAYGLWARGRPAIFGESGAVQVTPPIGRGIGVSGYADDTGVLGWGANFGVDGESTDGVGARGLSTGGDGVVGETFASDKSGVFGHSTDGFGVTGRSTNSYGVQGFGPTGIYGNGGIGVRGLGTTYGVYGKGAPHGAGVLGEGISAAGVIAQSDSGAGISASSKSGPGLVASSESADIIQGYGSSDSDIEFKVDNDGDVYADRAYHCGLGTGGEPGICIIQNSEAGDFAEMLPCDEGVEPGDVLVIDPDGRLTRSTEAYQTAVVGVYSATPGYLGGGKHLGQDGYAPLAVVGIVSVKASAENGPIAPGSLLVASSIPGRAMKAGPNPRVGTVIGKALGSLDSGTGVVQMLVVLQ